MTQYSVTFVTLPPGDGWEEDAVQNTQKRTNNMGGQCSSCQSRCGCGAAADKLHRATQTHNAKKKELLKARAALEPIAKRIAERDAPALYLQAQAAKFAKGQAAVAVLAQEVDEMTELEKKCPPQMRKPFMCDNKGG